MLADRRYCYPLTVTDFASRYLLTCEALATTKEAYAFAVFERAFKDFGLPGAIRTDNGVPFASPVALYGLSRLSVWWLRLGIAIERIKPGHPEQNGRHERMHLTLKTEATRPASPNFLQQQARFDTFVDYYNRDRPHQALGMQVPAERYTRSPRPYEGLGDLDYPLHDWTATVTHCGRISSGRLGHPRRAPHGYARVGPFLAMGAVRPSPRQNVASPMNGVAVPLGICIIVQETMNSHRCNRAATSATSR